LAAWPPKSVPGGAQSRCGRGAERISALHLFSPSYCIGWCVPAHRMATRLRTWWVPGTSLPRINQLGSRGFIPSGNCIAVGAVYEQQDVAPFFGSCSSWPHCPLVHWPTVCKCISEVLETRPLTLVIWFHYPLFNEMYGWLHSPTLSIRSSKHKHEQMWSHCPSSSRTSVVARSMYSLSCRPYPAVLIWAQAGTTCWHPCCIALLSSEHFYPFAADSDAHCCSHPLLFCTTCRFGCLLFVLWYLYTFCDSWGCGACNSY
jgi:hypothetical protein